MYKTVWTVLYVQLVLFEKSFLILMNKAELISQFGFVILMLSVNES